MKYILLAGVAVLLTACSSHESSPDPGGRQGTRYEVLQMPYGFRNVAAVCDGSTGVYVSSRSIGSDLPSGVAIYPNDPRCR